MPSKKSDLYSYQYAQSTVMNLEIKSRDEYRRYRLKDPKLPSNPERFYALQGWDGWGGFFNGSKGLIYASYAEAQSAACKLAIRSQPDYKKRRYEDSNLPAKPDETYRDRGWSTWYSFLKKSAPRVIASYENAKLHVLRLNITSRDEYRVRYLEDPSLPSNPNQRYQNNGWTNWYDFLGNSKPVFYESYTEAKSAVRALGINLQDEYRLRYYEDARLPATPNMIYLGKGWTSWTDYFGRTKRNLLACYSEAQTTVQKLGIKSAVDYQLRRAEVSGLPKNPSRYYSDNGWTTWSKFLGNKPRLFYDTYSEAQKAAQLLSIKSFTEYLTRYKEDPLLYSTPNRFYAESGWTSWADFLGTRKIPRYRNYQEAKLRVKEMDIGTREDYNLRYREDPRLVSNPFKVYANAGWDGWADYLSSEIREIYPTYAEARLAVQQLGIKTTTEYASRCKEDPHLPVVPYVFYATGWIDWYDFLGNYKPIVFSKEYPKIWKDMELWLENETNLPSKLLALKSFLGGFCAPLNLPDETRYLLVRENNFDTEAYQLFITNLADSARLKTHRVITYFFRWALDKYCTDKSEDERVIIPGCRNPFDTILAGFSDSLQFSKPSQSTKLPLGYEYILRAREYLVPNGDQVFINRPSFTDLSHLQSFFNSRVDWVDIDRSLVDFDDPSCVWRLAEGVIRDVDGTRRKLDVYQIWSPVRFVALYTLLRFPLRGQQILWLDSGEADNEIAVFDTVAGGIGWRDNTESPAGKGSNKRRPQGVLQRGESGQAKLYVTTNKTGARTGGYEIDWVPDDLAYWLVMLRQWQSKYNPLNEPTQWSNIALPTRVNKKILKARGTQTFLFRINGSGQPIKTSSVFEVLLPELLYRIQREHENLAVISPHIRYRYVSPYTPHSLRVSLITAFIVDGDAPIHLISKLVGHASLVMTIYYVKLGSEQMRRSMGETEKRAAQLVTERDAATIREQGIGPLRSQLIVRDSNRALIDSNIPNSACVVFDCGVCPMAAALCHTGGEPISERPNETIYGAVEAGYLGQKNCLRCRYFITGVPFLGGLVSLANEISLEVFTESGRYQHYSEQVKCLEHEFYDACKQNKPDTQAHIRKSATANMEHSASKLDGFLKDYASANHFIRSTLELIKTDTADTSGDQESGVRLVSAGGLEDIGQAFDESSTQYHLLSEICQNAAIYHSSNPSRAIPLISEAIDRMAENNNLKPAMFRLTYEQKIIVANELSALLLQRLGSWERIDDLFSGELMLLDVEAHDPKLTPISSEIQNLFLHGGTMHLNSSGTKK